MNNNTPRIRVWFSTSLCALILAANFSSVQGADGEPALPKTIGFNEHIRPIFIKHCTACHGGVKQAGEVSFVYRDQVLPPNGWIVEPGDPESSWLLDRVKSTDPEERMPPPEHGPALSQYEIGLLTRWIEQGAHWEEHWAFSAPKPQAIPTVQQTDWPLQPLDYFVLNRLEQRQIKPAPNATPERWLRRVTLDLTGLPPSLEARAAFLQDLKTNGESAYANVVDQLLASPNYGERWASVWLDQVRYADSKGLGLDGPRKIWKYRDWVISAFNDDLPYDQFTIKQIAGDLLPQPSMEDYIATAAHRLTQSNEEGGTDDEEFRVAAVLDRVSTTWQTWQGVTFGCVQCHSHPYDPFRHDEYYQFAAFFNNTADCDLNEEWPTLAVPNNIEDYSKANELDRQIHTLRQEIWHDEFALLNDEHAWQPLIDLDASTINATKVRVERVDDHDEFYTVDTVSQNTDFTLEAPLPETLQQLTAIRLTAMPLYPDKAVSDSEWGFELSHIEASLLVPDSEKPQTIDLARLLVDEPDSFHDPQQSLNPKSTEGFSTYTRIHYPRQTALVLKMPLEIPVGSKLRVQLKHRRFILASFALITNRGHLAVSGKKQFTELVTSEDYNQKLANLAALEKQRRSIPSTAIPILKERPVHLSRPTHVFDRGLFLTKADKVEPGTPASMPPLPEDLPANRLALAKWIVSPQNPLTARVAVNRFWARLFGVGLVATEEDFGSSGEAPSHPELLDDLALKFQNEFNWSIKQLLREIVLSRTYRQSRKTRPELEEIDSQNRLLARGPRHRLSAEIVRDQALMFAGLLSAKQFGPPVHPPIPDGVWKPFYGGDKWNTPKVGDENRYRRSIYTYVKRSIQYPMFAAFDAPSREFCTPRRLSSNTPLQALMTLNDESFIECTSGLARRMQNAGAKPIEQIRKGFLIVTCRLPRDSELQALLDLYHLDSEADPLSRLNTVASVLLNLDEVLTK